MQTWHADMVWSMPRTTATVAGGVRCLEARDFDTVEKAKARARKISTEHGRRLRCLRCDAVITEAEQRIAVAGTHAHRFTNPAGYVYDIGCFRSAPGCGHAGDLTETHTWFAGYRWQIAVCGRCGEHLGWRYQGGGGDSFHGLILERLVSEQ